LLQIAVSFSGREVRFVLPGQPVATLPITQRFLGLYLTPNGRVVRDGNTVKIEYKVGNLLTQVEDRPRN
jgi:hypothetical protein